MALDPFASNAPLIVYVDFKSPYAFVAKDPTRALAAEIGIEIDWRPLVLDIPSYAGSAKLGPDGRVAESKRSASQWSGVRYAYKDARRYAALAGLTLRGTTKIWDSALAGMGMDRAKAQGARVLERYMDLVFERFWRRELDIEDPAVIEAVLVESGADVNGFAAEVRDGRARFEARQREIFAAGIFGVPGYVLEGEYYFGREHLPRIRWLLTGRKGPAPDIAYPRFGASGGDAGARAPRPTSPVRVCIDFKSPQAFLALEPTRALETRLGVAFDWLPLLVPALSPPAPVRADDDRGTRHRRVRAAYFERDLARYAHARGLELGDVHRSPDTALASLGLLWMRSHAPSLTGDYMSRMFELVWRHGADPANAAVVEETLSALGGDSRRFRDDVAKHGAEPLAQLQRELAAAGVYSVPTYVVDGEPFLGRQHLPMIEWLMASRRDARAP